MSSLRRLAAITENELRLFSADLSATVLMIAMPIAVMPFIVPAMRFVVVAQGYRAASGAEQAIPGLALLFSSLAVTFVAFSFYREHGWRTWDRMRATPARPAEIVLGKALPAFGVTLMQLGVLFAIGSILYDLTVTGSFVALASMAAAHAALVVSFAFFLVATCRSIQQANAVASVGGIAAAGIGGAIAPVWVLPSWAQRVAPLTPTYWSMKGFRAVILDGAGVAQVATELAVVAGFATALGVATLVLFRMDAERRSWS